MPEITISFTCTPDQAQMLAALYAAITGDITDGDKSHVSNLPKALLAIQENLQAEADLEMDLKALDPRDESTQVFDEMGWSIQESTWMEAFLALDADQIFNEFLDDLQAALGGEDDSPDAPLLPFDGNISLN